MPKLPAKKNKASKSANSKSVKKLAKKSAAATFAAVAAAKSVVVTKPASAKPDPRFPIGPSPSASATITPADLKTAIAAIASFPKHLHKATHKLKDKKLDTPYREGGWTVRQLVHHIADSHATALFRVHKGLAEDNPTVPGYPEDAFARLADYTDPIDSSLAIIYGTHARWVGLLESLSPKDFQRTYSHAERGPQSIAQATMLYAWHSKHHLAHITHLRKEKKW